MGRRGITRVMRSKEEQEQEQGQGGVKAAVAETEAKAGAEERVIRAVGRARARGRKLGERGQTRLRSTEIRRLRGACRQVSKGPSARSSAPRRRRSLCRSLPTVS